MSNERRLPRCMIHVYRGDHVLSTEYELLTFVCQLIPDFTARAMGVCRNGLAHVAVTVTIERYVRCLRFVSVRIPTYRNGIALVGIKRLV